MMITFVMPLSYYSHYNTSSSLYNSANILDLCISLQWMFGPSDRNYIQYVTEGWLGG